MLSYQHAYHAGNPADLHKHAAFAALVALMTRKTRGITVMESHAGRGLYDLSGAEAARTGEAARGIARAEPREGPFARAIAAARAEAGAAAYPGSPYIARTLLRPQDRLILCELHPREHAALASVLAGPGIEIHHRDGHEALPALAPPTPRRGLALIDPSYEVKQEYDAAARTALALLAKWPGAAILLWYPLLPAGRHRALVEAVGRARLPGLFRSERVFAEPPPRGMTGSGLLGLNLPHGAAGAIREALGPFDALFRPA